MTSTLTRPPDQIEERLSLSKGIEGAVRTDNLAKQRGQLTNMLSIVSLVLTAIAGISLVVAGLGITTVMLVSVHERTREIGSQRIHWRHQLADHEGILDRSVGHFLCLGSLVGTLLGVGLCMLAGMLTGGSLWSFPLSNVAVSILSAVGVGVLFGVYPARKASRLETGRAPCGAT